MNKEITQTKDYHFYSTNTSAFIYYKSPYSLLPGLRKKGYKYLGMLETAHLFKASHIYL